MRTVAINWKAFNEYLSRPGMIWQWNGREGHFTLTLTSGAYNGYHAGGIGAPWFDQREES